MGWRVSLTNVDLPLPDTPVTHISFPNGNSTSICFRLLPLAPLITKDLPLPSRRFSGTSIFSFPFRYWEVRVSC